jgi:hypothetical protein
MITDRARAQWLAQYPAKFMACRQGHDFPKLIPGRKNFTRTWIEFNEDDGSRTIHQLCRNCRRERWRPLKRVGRGWLLDGKSWKYKDPKGYAQPPGYGISRSTFGEMYWDSIITEYDESAERMEAALEQES